MVLIYIEAQGGMTDDGCSPLCSYCIFLLDARFGQNMRLSENILDLPSSYVTLPSMMGLR